MSSMGTMSLSAAPAQVVDQLVAGDGIHPRKQRLALVPGVALEMHGQQRLLNHVLHILRTEPVLSKAAARQSTQYRRELLQQAVIRPRIAAHGGPHQLAQ